MCHNHSPAPKPNAEVVRRRERTAGEDAVPYEMVEPVAGSEAPWIVLVTDIYGINEFYRHLAERLAGAGYRVATPDLFHRLGPVRDGSRDAAIERRGRLDDQQAYTDLQQVVDEAVALGDGGARASFGTIGFCLGGTLALLSAADQPAQATVTYYAFPRAAAGAAVPAAHPIDVAGRVEGPVLAFWGREDYIDPVEVEELDRALDGAPGNANIVWFEGAGHAFLGGLTEERADSEAARASWLQTLEFFAKQLPVAS
jgi:carboxymethylenebutenolidase